MEWIGTRFRGDNVEAYLPNFVNHSTKQRGLIPLIRDYKKHGCKTIRHKNYKITLSDVEHLGINTNIYTVFQIVRNTDAVTHITLNVHALLNHSKNIKSIQLKGLDKRLSLEDVSIMLLDTKGIQYNLKNISEISTFSDIVYNITKIETNIFHFIISQISHQKNSFCLSNRDPPCCEFYNAYGELIFDYFQNPSKVINPDFRGCIFQIKLRNVILVMLSRYSNKQIVFYSHVYYFPTYVIDDFINAFNSKDFEMYHMSNFRLQVYVNMDDIIHGVVENEIPFFATNFAAVLFFQQSWDKLTEISNDMSHPPPPPVKIRDWDSEKLDKLVNNVLDEITDEWISPRTQHSQTTQQFLDNLRSSTLNDNEMSKELGINLNRHTTHEKVNEVYTITIPVFLVQQNEVLQKIMALQSSTQNQGTVTVPIRTTLGLQTMNELGLQTSNDGALMDASGSMINIETLNQMSQSLSGQKGAYISALMTASVLQSDPYLSLTYPNVQIQELCLSGFSIINNFIEQFQTYTPSQYSNSDSLTETVSKLLYDVHTGLIPFSQLRELSNILAFYILVLKNANVTEEIRALIAPQVGIFTIMLSVQKIRMHDAFERIEWATDKFGPNELAAQWSIQSQLTLPENSEILLSNFDKLSALLGAEQNLLPPTQLDPEQSVSTTNKLEFLLKSLKDATYTLGGMEDNINSLAQKHSNFDTIAVNGDLEDSYNLFKKDNQQTWYTIKLNLNILNKLPPIVTYDTLSLLGPRVNKLPFYNLTPPRQSPIQRSIDGNLVKLPFVPPNERPFHLLNRPTSRSSYTSSQPTIEQRNRLHKIALERLKQREQEAERLRLEKERQEEERLRLEEQEENRLRLEKQERNVREQEQMVRLQEQEEMLRLQEQQERLRLQEKEEEERNKQRRFWIIMSITLIFFSTAVLGILYYFNFRFFR